MSKTRRNHQAAASTRARHRKQNPDQLLLLHPTTGTCHWCGSEYIARASRDDLGACDQHYQHTQDQITRARTDPPLPF